MKGDESKQSRYLKGGPNASVGSCENAQSVSTLNQSTVMLDVSALIEEKDRMIRELKEKLIVSTHDPTPKGWNAAELEQANRRKTWCSSSSKNLKRLSFEIPRADQSLNIQTPTSLHDESETLSSNEIEVVKNQLAVLQGVIKDCNQSAMEEVAELQSKLNERTSDIKVLEVNINALQSKLDEAYSDKDVATKNHQQIIEEEQEKSREAMTKIVELEGYVSSLQTEIRDLGIHKEGFEEELKTLRDNLNEKEGLINEQKKLLASLNGHISELDANQTVLNEQAREIELLKNSLNETTAQLSEAQANIKDDVKNEELKICLANLKNEVVSLKANSQTLQEENEQLLASVQEKQKLSDDQKESINHLKIRISDMEGQLQIQISSAENEKEKLNEAISKGNEEILSLRKELTAIQDEKEQELLRFVEFEKDFQMKLDAKIAEAESLQVKIGEPAVKNCQFQVLTKTLEETTTLYKALQDDKTELILKVEKLQSKLTESNSSAIEMRKTIEEKLAVITSLSEETKMLATENDQLESQISDKTSIVEQLKKTLEETRNELKTVESKLKEFENLSRHHADEINKKENELAQVTKEKEVVEDLLASTKEEIQQLKFLTFRKLLEKEKELANLQKEHDVLHLSNSNLEVEFTTLRRSSNSAEEIISNQRKDIGHLKLKMAEFDQVQDLLTDSALKITELEEKMTMAANTEYELKHLRNEYATLEGVEKLKSEVIELKLEKVEHANSISTLNKNLDDFKVRYTSIMNEHQTVLKEKMEIGTQLAEAEYKITGLQEKLISLENRHGQQLKENKELLAELQSVKAVVKELESRAPVKLESRAQEKLEESQKEVNNCAVPELSKSFVLSLIDYKQAIDSVDRRALAKVLSLDLDYADDLSILDESLSKMNAL
ncbi:putative leucine-rich repeat-containing protein DDB_G0290503 [Artemia franciscana]|uniref:putative leucine-rich repeat-containing protein DDB_G0290503 n=1 Tax=Artemia franciscana TaxID=6661 RepID=UPI0032DA9547